MFWDGFSYRGKIARNSNFSFLIHLFFSIQDVHSPHRAYSARVSQHLDSNGRQFTCDCCIILQLVPKTLAESPELSTVYTNTHTTASFENIDHTIKYICKVQNHFL